MTNEVEKPTVTLPDSSIPGSREVGADESATDLDILNSDEGESEETESKDTETESSKEESETEETTESESEEEPEVEEDVEEEEEVEKEEETEKEPDIKDEILSARGKELVGKIKAASPDLLKKVPELRAVIFRDHEYGKLFPTVADAREASERVQVLGQLEQSVYSGDPSTILAAIAQTDHGLYRSFVGNILPLLRQYDTTTYVELTVPIIKNALRAVLKDGQNTKDENLANAARIISKHFFQSYDVPEDPKPDPKLEEERQRLQQERSDWYQGQWNGFQINVKSKAAESLKSEVEKSITNLRIPDITREALVVKIIQKINETLGKDDSHKGLMDSLWKRAMRSRMSEEAATQLISTYLGRARRLLAPIRQEYIRGLNQTTVPKGKVPQHKVTPTSSGGRMRTPSKGQVDWSKTSDLDFLAGGDRIHYRR